MCPHLLWLAFITLTCLPHLLSIPIHCCIKPVSGVSLSCSSQQRGSRLLGTAGLSGEQSTISLYCQLRFTLIFCVFLSFFFSTEGFMVVTFANKVCFSGFNLKFSLDVPVMVKPIFAVCSKKCKMKFKTLLLCTLFFTFFFFWLSFYEIKNSFKYLLQQCLNLAIILRVCNTNNGLTKHWNIK